MKKSKLDHYPIEGQIVERDDLVETIIERRLVGLNESGHASAADAEFIAHAREDIPWLLAALAARDAEVRQLATVAAAVVAAWESSEDDRYAINAGIAIAKLRLNVATVRDWIAVRDNQPAARPAAPSEQE